MLSFIMKSEKDVSLLTCGACAFDVYRDLVESGCKFLQSKEMIAKELDSDNEVFEITKLVAEGKKEDVYFLFALEDEKFLRDRIVVIDTCVEEDVCEDRIPLSSEVIHEEDDFVFGEIRPISEDDDLITPFIKSLLNLYEEESEEEEDEESVCLDSICDECLAISEIMSNEEITLEEALREAYRMGKESAIVEIIEIIGSVLYK